jgi:alpha-1,2-mannosyltransferase
VFVVASAAAVAAALWLFDVRDWRCYGAVFLWPAVLTAVSIGTLTPLLLLGVAVVWRYRNTLGIAALAAAAVIAAKLFLWPVVVWLWATGRRGTAAAAVALAVAASAACWAWIRFAGMTGYPNLLHRITEVEAPYGYGAAWIVGGALLVAGLSFAFLVLCGVLRRDDRVLFSVAIVAALVLTPILWLHYLCLLAAPVALVRPRFSPVWVVPAVLWLTPQQQAFESPWRIAAVFLVLAAVLAATLSPRRSQPEIGDNVPNPAPWPSPVRA